MKIKKSTQATIEVPATTFNALKGLLFTKSGGVDLSGIIDDLGGDDLTAVNVALAYNNMIPEIDKSTRFAYNWRNTYYEYVFVSYSLIRDMVKVEKYTKNHEDVLEYDYPDIQELSYEGWLNLSTDNSEIKEKCSKYFEENNK